MPSCCSVPGCRSNYKTEEESVKVFQFPSNEERRALWLRSIPRKDWVPSKRSVVCIHHFKSEDIVTVDSVQRPDGSYLVVPRSYYKLKPDAVPCIFNPEDSPTTPEDSNEENQSVEDYFDGISVIKMPFFWKPENKRTQISPERMKSAVLQVVAEGKSIRSAAKEHRIDRKTLGRYVQKFRNTKDEEIELKPNYSSAQIFTDDEEKLLEEYLTLAAEIHNGLTSKVARQFAYEHGIAHNKTLPDNWYATKCASYDWLRGFLHRHRSFSLKNPHSVGFGVNEFSDELKPRNKFIAEVFESGLANVQNSKTVADIDKSSTYHSNSIGNFDKSDLYSVYNPNFGADVDESVALSVHDSKKVVAEQGRVPTELQTVHDPDCLLNTTGSSNFTPFCTCQYKSENHVSITPVKEITPVEEITPVKEITPVDEITPVAADVSDPCEIYILPTNDEPDDAAAPEVIESSSEVRSSKSNQKRTREESSEPSDHTIANQETENEPDLKESKRTRRKRKL